MCALAGPADSAEIRIEPGTCATGLHLAARDAPLFDVLRKLADVLDFQLQFDCHSESRVNIDATLPPSQLVARLSPVDSTIVSEIRDPRCPQRYRIAKVWVLAKGANGPPRDATRGETAQEKARRLDEMSRQAREAYDSYVRANGRPPPGVEEEAAKSR